MDSNALGLLLETAPEKSESESERRISEQAASMKESSLKVGEWLYLSFIQAFQALQLSSKVHRFIRNLLIRWTSESIEDLSLANSCFHLLQRQYSLFEEMRSALARTCVVKDSSEISALCAVCFCRSSHFLSFLILLLLLVFPIDSSRFLWT
jgi:hypothetical protein